MSALALAEKIATLEAELSALREQQKSLKVKVLVVGSGGREHAIAWKLAQSPKAGHVYVAPGNGGTFSESTEACPVENVSGVKAGDVDGIVAFAKNNAVDLVVVGPEIPLVNGLADRLTEEKIKCFGPSKAAAVMEGSKAFSKDFMARHNIPTAEYRSFTDYEEARSYVEQVDFQVVIKASGLAAGKGVLMSGSKEQALVDLKSVMLDGAFGDAGAEIVIEELLVGEEASCMGFCDGKTIVAMPAAQDHKRVGDGDRGLNTGGMGAYAPAPVVSEDIAKEIYEKVLKPTIDGLAKEGRTYVGVLYPGLMITKQGIRVLEYNCRFGDPETQVLLPLLKSDLLEVMLACTEGTLDRLNVEWHDASAVTVVGASRGYPRSYPKGKRLYGLGEFVVDPETMLQKVFHAGTRWNQSEGAWETSGGRVLTVTAVSKNGLPDAVRYAYQGMRKIHFEGIQYRNDIARRGLGAVPPPVKLGILGSTRGTDMLAIIEAINAGRLNAVINVVVSNVQEKPGSILANARKHGIEVHHVPKKKSMSRREYDIDCVSTILESSGCDLVLMIGYMRIVSAEFCNAWKNRLINVHPSLLPEFAGGMDTNVHEEVLKAGKKLTGCTVHIVTEEVDGGPVLVQKPCMVHPDETVDTLKSKVQALEGEALIESVRMFSDGFFPRSRASTLTYASAGVNIAEGNALIDDIKPACKSTRRPGCNADLGGFGGLFDLKEAGYIYDDTVLVSCTDGVGTKLKVAQATGKHDTVGIDLVAMSVNDLIVQGAEPLLFLDYYACGKLDRSVAAAVVRGIADGCRQAGCALIGGETAEMPGMYQDGDYDLAGFATGAVRKSKLLPREIVPGQVLIGLPSSGIHSNGFSLVRKLLSETGHGYKDPCPFDPSRTIGEVIMEPTCIYVKECKALFAENLVEGLAHITGGGLVENIPRVLKDSVACEIDASTWKEHCPPIFSWIASKGLVPLNDLFRTFNCGIGMVLFVKAEYVSTVLGKVKNSIVIGNVVDRGDPGTEQVKIEGSPW
eukprot:g2775.t1